MELLEWARSPKGIRVGAIVAASVAILGLLAGEWLVVILFALFAGALLYVEGRVKEEEAEALARVYVDPNDESIETARWELGHLKAPAEAAYGFWGDARPNLSVLGREDGTELIVEAHEHRWVPYSEGSAKCCHVYGDGIRCDTTIYPTWGIPSATASRAYIRASNG